jgi:hypothetical protein
MVQRKEIDGVRTNKTVKYSYSTSDAGKKPVQIWMQGHVVPLSGNKQGRWEFVEEVEALNQSKEKPKETKKERTLRNQEKKKEEFKDELKNQKQKHAKRVPTPVDNVVEDEELLIQITPQTKDEEDDGDWKIYHRYSGRNNKARDPSWNYYSSRPGIDQNQIWRDADTKTRVNHLSPGINSHKETYGKVSARDARRRLKGEVEKFTHNESLI